MNRRLHGISEIVVIIILITAVIMVSVLLVGYLLGLWSSFAGQGACKISPLAAELRFSASKDCAVGLLLMRVEGCEAEIDRVIIQGVVEATRPNVYDSRILKPGLNYIVVYGPVYATVRDADKAFSFSRTLINIGLCLENVEETMYKGELVVKGYVPLHIVWVPAGPP